MVFKKAALSVFVLCNLCPQKRHTLLTSRHQHLKVYPPWFYMSYCLQFACTDYSIAETQLAFLPSRFQSQMNCTTIIAIIDDRLEETETFAFTLQSSDPEVTTGPNSTTTVTVFDTTGECNGVGFVALSGHVWTVAAAISLSVQETRYTVAEGQAVSVCAEVESGILDRAVSVFLSFIPDSAQGQFSLWDPITHFEVR